MHFLSPYYRHLPGPHCVMCVFLKCVIFQFVKCITFSSLLWAVGLIMTSASPLKGKSFFFFKTVSASQVLEALFNLFMSGILNDTLRQKKDPIRLLFTLSLPSFIFPDTFLSYIECILKIHS